MARIAILLHRPHITGITGSVGKTTTKDMVVCILKEANISFRASQKSYNSEFGVPLTILGVSSGLRNPFVWIWQIIKAFFNMFFNVPKHLVLEIGLEYPGDIHKIISWLKTDVSCITHLAKVPVHLENFSSKEELYLEKISLFDSVKKGGIKLFNSEDPVQRRYVDNSWVDLNSIVSIVSYDIHHDSDNPVGMDVVLNVNDKEETFYIPNVISIGAVNSLVQAVSIVLSIDNTISISTIRKAVASQLPTSGRGRIVPGLNASTIIDETYNASPVAVKAALNILGLVNKSKKIVVLGKMLQLGDDEDRAHAEVGELADKVADKVIVIDDAPYGVGEQMTHDKAIQMCKELADSKTVFLFKGSQGARIEKIVRELVSEDIDPAEYLVRQEKHWLG